MYNFPVGGYFVGRPYSAIGFRGKLFLRYPPPPPSKPCLWTAIGHFYGKKWGCSSDSLRFHRHAVRQGLLLHLSRGGGGGYFSRGTEPLPSFTTLQARNKHFGINFRGITRNIWQCNFQKSTWGINFLALKEKSAFPLPRLRKKKPELAEIGLPDKSPGRTDFDQITRLSGSQVPENVFMKLIW